VNEILLIGIVLFGGYLGGKLIAKIKVPAVTGYILVGLAFGVSSLKLIPWEWNLKLSWLIDFALLLIAFHIGGELRISRLRKMGKSIMLIVTLETVTTYLLLLGTMLILREPLALGLLIASIGAATAPAVTVLVLNEYRAQGPLSQTLLACVGIDDAYGLTLYSLSASLAHSLFSGTHIFPLRLAGIILAEIGTSILGGIIIGMFLDFLLRRIKYSVEVLTMVLGGITLAGGLLEGGIWGLRFSHLLGAMAAGFYLTNYSPKRREAFAPLENFGYPFYTIYFVLAGARLKLRLLFHLGWVAVGYLLARFSGKILGAGLGGLISLVAAKEFPQVGDVIVAIALGTTIVTEIIGPFSAKYAITKADEVGKRVGPRI
jgi:Kef-type K+ transport system membrane component KefB